MTEPKTYTGGCHCKNVRYEVKATLDGIITCNCSICAMKGLLLTFVPRDAFKLLAGEDATQDYQFHRKTIHHLFCKTCGVSSYAHGEGPNGPMTAINVRCLDDVDIGALALKPFDGKSR
ncbi:MAG: GFA family protein [Labilithrix sp.]|nr:GFA family protein [Labilithrix sp.]